MAAGEVGVAACEVGAANREVHLGGLLSRGTHGSEWVSRHLLAKVAGTSPSHVKDVGPSFKDIIYLNDYHAKYFGDLFTSISMG